MKLLDRSGGNTKLRKTNNKEMKLHFAGLSMHPDDAICAGAKAAGCMDDCLKEAGLGGVYPSVNLARKAKTDFYLSDQVGFLTQLRRELTNYVKWCNKKELHGVVRLNVLSDIPWETHNIPQDFPELSFYDYTKVAKRFHKGMPSNYQLMFSYSGKPTYKKQVLSFLKSGSDSSVAVVFNRRPFPDTFMGRDVIDGDSSDWVNVNNKGVVVGLTAKGPAKHNNNGFVVDVSSIPVIAIGGM